MHCPACGSSDTSRDKLWDIEYWICNTCGYGFYE